LKDQPGDLSLVTAQKLAVAEMFASYLHDQSNMISTLSALASRLFHDMNVPRELKSLEASITNVIDELHDHNYRFQKLLHAKPDSVEPLPDILESMLTLFRCQRSPKIPPPRSPKNPPLLG
jgi:hypothetical protein